MCWNADVSLNTFLFSSVSLGFIAYNNAYTPYRLTEFHSWSMNLFLFSFISMQLLEYFLWKQIHSRQGRQWYSRIGMLIILIQPLASLLLVSSVPIRIGLMMVYSVVMIWYYLQHQELWETTTVTVSPNGHLNWKWWSTDGTQYVYVAVWLCCFFFPMIWEWSRHPWISTYALLSFAIVYFLYRKEHVVNSMWCWIANGLLMGAMIVLVGYLPFHTRTTPSRLK